MTPNSQHHRVSVTFPTDDGPDRWAAVDAMTYAMTTINYDHHEVHGGSSYVVSGTATLGNGATQDILVVTPNTTKWAHLIGLVTSSGLATVTFYEGATVSNAGAATTEVNRNRNSTNTAGVVVTTGPTVTGTGTAIFSQSSGAGQNVGGEVRGENEFILKQNTIYLLRITSAAAANVVNYILDWYEHTSKE